MSADNGIYILITLDNYKSEKGENIYEVNQEPAIKAFRVAVCSAIDNFTWYKENQIYMLGKYMYDVWGRSEVFYTWREAEEYAKSLSKRFDTEYGIQSIDAREFSFN